MSIVKIASKLFARNLGAQKFTKVLPNRTTIEVMRDGATGLKKVVTQPNGDKVTSYLSKDGKFVNGIKEETSRGTISQSFGGLNYDKVVQVQPNIGGEFTFLGHTDRPNGILSSDMSGRYIADNKYMPQYQEALDYIRGKNSQYLYSFSRLNAK